MDGERPRQRPAEGLLLNCVGCHSLERVMRSPHDADAFTKTVLPRMQGYVNRAFRSIRSCARPSG